MTRDKFLAAILAETASGEVADRIARLCDDYIKSQKPDWYWCQIDPDESGDSPHEAMHMHRPRLTPVELGSSYVGPVLWGVMSPPLPDADDDGETDHVFSTREEAEAFCAERAAIFERAEQEAEINGLATPGPLEALKQAAGWFQADAMLAARKGGAK